MCFSITTIFSLTRSRGCSYRSNTSKRGLSQWHRFDGEGYQCDTFLKGPLFVYLSEALSTQRGNTLCSLGKRHSNRWLDATARGPLFFCLFFFPVLAPGPDDSNLGVSESSDSSLAGLLSGPRAEGYSSLWLTQPPAREAPCCQHYRCCWCSCCKC